MMIPDTMQAVQLLNSGHLTVGPLPVPRPGAGEVLVRMAAAPVNPSDLGRLSSTDGSSTAPVVPGIEGSGTVVAAGSGIVPRLWLGKRVTCASAGPASGTWAEYMVTPALRCFPLSRDISLEQGAMLVVNPMTALAFFDIARREKHRALINNAAASALGRMIMRLGQKHHLPVINIVRRQAQVDLLHSLGAKYVLNSNDAGFREDLRKLAHDLKATLVLDAVGGDQTAQLLDAAPFGSTLLVYASLDGEPRGLEPRLHDWVYEDKRLAGFYLANWIAKQSFIQTLRDTWRVQRLARTSLQTAVQKRLPLSAVEEGLELYRANMTAGKVLLVADFQAVPLG